MCAMDMLFVPFVFLRTHRRIPNSGFHLHMVPDLSGQKKVINIPFLEPYATFFCPHGESLLKEVKAKEFKR